jgi:enoyl-CoA hydratase
LRAIWPLAVGPARAKQYLLTGDPLLAAKAERIGPVNRVVPAADLDREATEFTDVSPSARRSPCTTPSWRRTSCEDALNLAFDASTALALVSFQSEDHQCWRRCARSACPSSRIAERRLPP